MPFKMIAIRTVYRPDEAKEYQKGQSFTVKSEIDRDRLLKARRAKLVEDAKPAAKPSIKTKVMTPEPAPQEAAPVEQPASTNVTPASTSDFQSIAQPRASRFYRRSDLRSED